MPQSAPTPTPAPPRLSHPLRYRVFAAAGNRFALLDATSTRFSDPAGLARHICGPQNPQASQAPRAPLDGILFAEPPTTGGTCRMLLYNADGSRAQACGNGLRCMALFAHLAGLARGTRVLVETDCGTREVELLDLPPAGAPSSAGPALARARAAMGQGRILERAAELSCSAGSVRATLVDVGNPHCVIAVPDVESAAVAQLGAALEAHPHFPEGTNVEFVARGTEGLRMRVWERGVGETGACGTGACAAALALAGDTSTPFEVQVASPGGRLTVERDAQRELWLTGPCEAHEWLEYTKAVE